MYRKVTCYLTCMFHWEPELIFVLFGKGEGRSRATCTQTSSHILSFSYFVTYFLPRSPYYFWILISWGYFALGAGWISHFFKDLEAETIHVCIAWALLKYLGCAFFSRLFALFSTVRTSVCFVFYWAIFFSLYIGYIGWMGDTRYPLLPCHGDVAGWVWLRAKPWDAELFSVWNRYPGGLFSRNFWRVIRPYALKMVLLHLIFSWLLC